MATDSRYNHKYKLTGDALGFLGNRAKDLDQIVADSIEVCARRGMQPCFESQVIEEILSHGLDIVEATYCGYRLGVFMQKKSCPLHMEIEGQLQELEKQGEKKNTK